MENDKHLPIFRLVAVKGKAGMAGTPNRNASTETEIFNIQ